MGLTLVRHPSSRFLDDRVRLASIVGAALLVALAISVVFTVSRFDTALSAADEKSLHRADALEVERIDTAFWSTREAMNEYFVVPSPELFAEVQQQQPRAA